MNNVSDVICGIGAFFTTWSVVGTMPESDIWSQLIVAVLSALAFAIVNIIGKIITSWLEKKGVISHKDKESIDHTLDDLADDGKINNSNDEDNSEKDEKDE